MEEARDGQVGRRRRDQVTMRVWGEHACFTRPGRGAEGQSYPVMTPSAARGVLEAIFWDPQFYYLIDTIRVVRRGEWFSFSSIEGGEVVHLDRVPSLRGLENGGAGRGGVRGRGGRDEYGGLTKSLVQSLTEGLTDGGREAGRGVVRSWLGLQGVEYLITAEIRLTELSGRTRRSPEQFGQEIRRRARLGKCFHRPCLGLRQFDAFFVPEPDPVAAFARRARELARDVAEKRRAEWTDPFRFNADLGPMLYDLFPIEDRAIGFRWRPNVPAVPRRENRPLSASRARRLSGSSDRPGLPGLPELPELPKLEDGPAWRARRADPEEPYQLYEGRLTAPRPVFFDAKVREGKLDCHPSRIELIDETRDRPAPGWERG